MRFEDLSECTPVGSTDQHFRTYLDGMKTIFRKREIHPKAHLKDANCLEDFRFDLSPKEVLLGSDTGPGGYPQNPHIVKIRFNDLTLFNSAYLLYRKTPLRPVVSRFVEACHRAENERRAQASFTANSPVS